MNSLTKWTGALSAVIALSTTLAGCSTGPSATAPVAQSAAKVVKQTSAAKYRVGLVTDVGGLNDHSFNHLAYVGLLDAHKKYGISYNVVQSTSSASYVPNLTAYASQGYNLVIAVGFLMESAVEQVSKQYPNTKFMIIDDAVTDRKNVASALFSTEQCGYLVGVMSGLMNKEKGIKQINGHNVIGVVGGQDIPPVESYIAGFEAGVKKVDPKAKILLNWANSFSDPGIGKEIALQQISQGADIVFPVAGQTGDGVIQAAALKNVFAIGVDANQNYLAKQNVMTSALKSVDVATSTIIGEGLHGKFKSGIEIFDLKNHGVSFAPPIKAVPAAVLKQVDSYIPKLESGAIKAPAMLSTK